MKNTYVKPEMQVEEFLAENYCSSTCTSGKKYKFVCDAAKGTVLLGLNMGGEVWIETNGESGLQMSGSNPDTRRSSYHSCQESHEADTNDEFHDGYFRAQATVFGGFHDPIPVKVWYGADGNNTHCTTNTTESTWEIIKS